MVCPLPALLSLAGSIIAYPLPSIYPTSSVFSLSAGQTEIPVMKYYEYDYAHFSMASKPAVITITVPDGTEVKDIRISPKKLGIKPTHKSNCISFTLPKDEYVIVKINNLKELVIAADALETSKPPTFGPMIYNIRENDYKADNTGKSLVTKQFQQAIDDAEKGFNEAKKKNTPSMPVRSTVYVPQGVYTVGNLVLKSNTELYLEPGAFLRFSGNKTDYTAHWHKSSQGRDVTWWIRTGFNTTNIKIFGRGTLDGNGKHGSDKGKINNNILVPIATKHFEVDGIIIKESSSWSTIPMRSSDLVFKNIKWFNSLSMSENDGIDPMESQRVTIKHAIAISLDDPFSTKTFTKIFPKYNAELPAPKALEDVVFDDCIAWTRCFGFKVGQGVFMPHKKVTFQNSVVYDAAIGIGINHRWGTSSVDDVTFDKIDIEKISLKLENRSTWLAFFTEDPKDGDKKNPTQDGAGPVSHVRVKNINVYDKGLKFGLMEGLNAKANISKVFFENVKMPGQKKPAANLKELNIQETKFTFDIKVDNNVAK